jgi:hypothetical protein
MAEQIEFFSDLFLPFRLRGGYSAAHFRQGGGSPRGPRGDIASRVPGSNPNFVITHGSPGTAAAAWARLREAEIGARLFSPGAQACFDCVGYGVACARRKPASDCRRPGNRPCWRRRWHAAKCGAGCCAIVAFRHVRRRPPHARPPATTSVPRFLRGQVFVEEP